MNIDLLWWSRHLDRRFRRRSWNIAWAESPSTVSNDLPERSWLQDVGRVGVGWIPGSGDVDSRRFNMLESVHLVADVVETCANRGTWNETEETKIFVLLLPVVDGDVAIVSTTFQAVRRVGVSSNSGIETLTISISSRPVR